MKSKFSKALVLLLALALLTTQIMVPAFAVSATAGYCNVCKEEGIYDPDNALHTIAPTCGKEGYSIFKCLAEDCTGTVTIKVPATGVHERDGVVVSAVAAGCITTGTKAYETCKHCDTKLEPGTNNPIGDIVVPATGHTFNPVDADPADCIHDGTIAYKECTVCEKKFAADAATNATQELTSIKDPANGVHDYVDVDAKAPDCFSVGWDAYKKCSVCDAIDPDHPYVEHDKLVHDGQHVITVDAECTEDGKRIFYCGVASCKYYSADDGVTGGMVEVLTKTGHTFKDVSEVPATCLVDGVKAHKVCTVCNEKFAATVTDKFSTAYVTDAELEIACAGEHTPVEVGYQAPTCTVAGTTNKVICDICKEVLHAGEAIEATGHTDLTNVGEQKATCTDAGNIAYVKCNDCEAKFAPDKVVAGVVAADVAPLANVVIDALGHTYDEVVVNPTCTEQGYIVNSCNRGDDTPSDPSDDCDHVYSTFIDPTGHKVTAVAKVEPTCGSQAHTGMEAHYECETCHALFASTATVTNGLIAADAVAVEASTLVIPELVCVEKIVSKVNPTYNAAGHEAGKICAVCGESLQNAATLDELEEAINFHYEVKGVNGADKAVNSGYVTVDIYFDVLKSRNDKDEYNSDVIANIYGLDYRFDFDDIFTLTDVTVAPGLFAAASFTNFELANQNNSVMISQDMMNGSKEFRGADNLFATLTFQVADTANVGDYTFTGLVDEIMHTDGVEVIGVSYLDEEDNDVSSVNMEVIKLGDPNGDGVFNVADTHALMTYYNTENAEYNTVYDMDKDGDVDFVDFGLLRNAIVGNNDYLDIEVDPNSNINAEV